MMRSADEIAASLLERRRTTSARGWFDDLQKDITAAITAARRDGAEQVREEIHQHLNGVILNYSELGFRTGEIELIRNRVMYWPLPGDEPKEPTHAK